MSASDLPDAHTDPMATGTCADLMSEAEYRRRLYIPGQVDSTARKLKALIAEAERYGMTDLVDTTWDRIILEAQAYVAFKGGSIGFGDGKP